MTTLLSLLAMGAVVLYVAFTVLAGIGPTEAASVSAVIDVLAALLALRYLRLDHELRSRGEFPG